MSTNGATERSEYEPAWTVVTTPPNFAERWALAAARSFQHAGSTAQLVMVAIFVLEAFATWSNGQRGWMVFNLVMAAFAAFSAWERYAFGLLFGRYEAELRDLQTKR